GVMRSIVPVTPDPASLTAQIEPGLHAGSSPVAMVFHVFAVHAAVAVPRMKIMPPLLRHARVPDPVTPAASVNVCHPESCAVSSRLYDFAPVFTHTPSASTLR